MPAITTGVLVTMALQVAASVANQIFSKRNAEEIKSLQQKYREEMQANNQFHAWEKFQSSCTKQTEMEFEAHKNRIEKIEEQFKESFKKNAYREALNRWPLNINPYFIKNSVLSFNPIDERIARKELFCILTNSNKENFNSDIFPLIESELNNYISRYWNANSTHTVCFYDNIWKKDLKYCDNDIPNLRTILPVPMVVISPYFDDIDDDFCKIHFKLNAWGVGNCNQSISYTPEPLSVKFKKQRRYDRNECANAISELVPQLVCLIGFFVDNYYWAYYHEKPIMPSLLASGKLGELFENEKLLDMYRESYMQMYDTYINGSVPELQGGGTNNYVIDTAAYLKDVAEINQFNFPERSLDLCEGIKGIVGINSYAQMLEQAFKTLLRQRGVDDTNKTIEQLFTAFNFSIQDMEYLSHLAKEFKQSKYESLGILITNKIKVYIETSPVESMDWSVEYLEEVQYVDVLNYIKSNKIFAPNAFFALIGIRKKYIYIAYYNEQWDILYNNKLGGRLITTNSLDCPNDVCLINNCIVIDLKNYKCLTNKELIMSRFDKFEKLGKQLDEFVNTIRPHSQNGSSDEQTNSDGTLSDLVEYFKNEQSVLMESETVNCATIDLITTWVNNKLPVDNAKKMCIVKSPTMLCLIFLTNEGDALVDNTPKKRIFYKSMDNALVSAFNGKNYFIINI